MMWSFRRGDMAAARRRLSFVLGVAVLALPGGASADEVISGSGHVAATDFTVSIHAGPNGENPSGFLTLSGFYNFTATPSCVNVAGNVAVSGYRVDTGPYAGQGFLASVQGNGGLGGGSDSDQVFYSGVVATPPTACQAPSDPPPPFEFTGGGGPLVSGSISLTGGPAATAPPWRPSGIPTQPGPVGPQPATVAPAAGALPTAVTNLRAVRPCVQSAQLASQPTESAGGLAFSFDLNQDATLQYAVLHRDGSPAQATCPAGLDHPPAAGSYAPDTYTAIESLSAPTGRGSHQISIGTAARAQHTTSGRLHALRSRRFRRAHHTIRIGAHISDLSLPPGTYVLMVRAKTGQGAPFKDAFAKFWVLAG